MSEEIKTDLLERMLHGPIHMITDSSGMVIGNSQHLAREVLRLTARVKALADYYDRGLECLASNERCDHINYPFQDKCPCEIVNEVKEK